MTGFGNSLRRLRCVFLDLDNTLYDADKIYQYGLKLAWRYWCKQRSVSFRTFLRDYGVARRQVKADLRHSTSSRNRVLYFKRITENVFGKPEPRLVLGMIKAYDQCWAKMDVQEARWVLSKLSKAYRIGIVTNQVCLTQLQKIDRIDPESRWIKAIVTSEEVNSEKPRPRIFFEACRRIGFSPHQCVVIGDDWKMDVMGPLRYGFCSIFIDPDQKRRSVKVPTVRHLRDVVRLLDKP